MPVPITAEQAAQLQAKVTQLINDKSAADAATDASNQAGSALLAAHDADAAAKIAEASADGTVTADLNDLLAFVGTLTGTTISTTPTTPPAPPTP